MQLISKFSMKPTLSQTFRPLELSKPSKLSWLSYKQRQVFVLGVKTKYRRQIFRVRGVTHQTHSHMYNSIYTHGDCFPLRPEIWPWRQDYGGRPSFLLPFWLGFLPWRPWPITQCFFNLCFKPGEDDPPLLTFSKAAATFLDQDPWQTATQYGKMKRALCLGGSYNGPPPWTCLLMC